MNAPEERGFYDRDFEYIYKPKDGVLTPNQVLNTQVSINVDAEFWIACWFKTGDAVYDVMVTDSSGYQFSNIPLQSAGIPTVADPAVFSPAHPLPAGGRIQLTIRELAGATAEMELHFKGWKRFQNPVAPTRR